MAWGPDKCAGFALAAILADDRALTMVADALTPAQRESVRAHLPQGTREQVALQIGSLLRLVKPELQAKALSLPAGVRRLIANGAPGGLRAQLMANVDAPRKGFSPDDALVAALLRIARNAPTRAERP